MKELCVLLFAALLFGLAAEVEAQHDEKDYVQPTDPLLSLIHI